MKEITYSDYLQKSKEFVASYKEEVSDHVLDVVASVMMTRDNFRQGGSFVQAVVKNDLFYAISYGDRECLANLRIIVLANQYAHLNHKI